MGYRIGIDIGGTFTDLVVMNEESGDFQTFKVPSTPENPSLAVESCLRKILENNLKPHEIVQVVHGTTIATNAILEKKGAKTGLMITEGFEDILYIARQKRTDLYDIFVDAPEPLVPRHLTVGVRERINSEGKVLRKLSSVSSAIAKLKKEQVESVAVSFLHSYRNPEHEKKVKEAILRNMPQVHVSLSSEVLPEYREFERTSTTVINAYIQPKVANYLQNIENMLKRTGISSELYMMESNGGIMTSNAAKRRPCNMVESGPTAGVIIASHIGNMIGKNNLISLDIGGTTAKAALIERGEPRITNDFEVGGIQMGGRSATKGSGFPIRTPAIDLVEVGTGGGSLAWIDRGGVLRVGPKSAGANPGPVCYALGGTEPTVTDADIVMGRINPDYFLGGKMKLHVEGAKRAIEKKIATPLDIGLEEAAYGISEVSDSNMLRALRLVSIERGYDPREFSLIAFGGAGPVHAGKLAQDLGILTVIVPPTPGVTSAFGLLVTDIRHDYVITSIQETAKVDFKELNETYSDIENRLSRTLQAEKVAKEDARINRAVDMRYVGQSYELSVPVPNSTLDEKSMASVVEEFHRIHNRCYGHSDRNQPTQIVNLRVTATGAYRKPTFRQQPKREKNPQKAFKNRRGVYFRESNGFIKTPCYERTKLAHGNEINGPAVIEQVDSTTVVYENQVATVDDYDNIIFHLR